MYSVQSRVRPLGSASDSASDSGSGSDLGSGTDSGSEACAGFGSSIVSVV